MNAIQNGILILPDEHGRFVAQTELVLCYDERIMSIVPAAEFTAEGVDKIIDAAGAYVAPGFVNVHIHGCDGADTMDEDADALGKIAAFQARTGVTSFLPTTMTCAYDAVERALVRIRRAMTEKSHGARILGSHMEGPLSAPQRRAHRMSSTFSPPHLQGSRRTVMSSRSSPLRRR